MVRAERRSQVQARSSFHLLSNKTFSVFILGSFLSSMGFWIQSIGQSWQVLQMTNSALLLGLVAFAATAPNIVFSLFGGVIVDRFNRQRLVIVVQIVYMLTALYLGIATTLHIVTVWQIICMALINGVCSCVGFPGWQAFIGDLVPAEDLKQGIALNSVQFNLSRVIGPAVGGLSIALVGIAGSYYLNMLSYVFVVIPLFFMHPVQHNSESSREKSLWQGMNEGLTYTFHSAKLMLLLFLQLLIAFLVFPYITLLPIFARDVFHIGAGGLGVLNSAAGIGALVGSVLVVFASRRMSNGVRMLLWACVIGGLACAAFAMTPNLQMASFWLIVVGSCTVMSSTIANAAVQTLVPEEMRGRVLSILALILFGLAPFGNLTAGWIAGTFGSQMTLAIGGILCVALSLLTFVLQLKFAAPVQQKAIA
ncbi:MAG TPA: MFS transporter [Ktedonobacteraceae bacterium]|jgi:MFS family permease|nr:MFS transporter [Ktedonobacteraceae bacterium]